MMRYAIYKGIENAGTPLLCLLTGSLAAKVAKYFGAPIEIGIVVFVLVTVLAFLISYAGDADE